MSEDQKIDSSTKVAAIAGLPLTGLVVWWMDNLWLKPRGLTMEPASAVIAGGLGALILGEIFKDISNIYRRIMDKLLERLK